MVNPLFTEVMGEVMVSGLQYLHLVMMVSGLHYLQYRRRQVRRIRDARQQVEGYSRC